MQLLLNRRATVGSGPLKVRDGLLERLVRQDSTDIVNLILPYVRDRVSISSSAHVALRKNNTSMLALLLDHGADLDSWNAKGTFDTALEECAYYGNLKMARFLLSRPNSVGVNQTGGRYHTPLIASVCLGEENARHLKGSGGKRKEFAERRLKRHIKMFDFLLDKGANVKATGGVYGNVLIASASRASLALMRHVIDWVELPLDWVDNEGRSMAHLACAELYGSINKLSFLTKKSGRRLLELEDNLGRRPLHFASGSSMARAVLAKLGIEHVSARDHDGWTPLHWACRQKDVQAIETLIKHGADVSAQTKDNWRPWHVAIYHDNGAFGDLLDADKYREEPDLPKAPGVAHWATCASCFVVSL